jgi:hypothetical protein
VCIDGTTCAKLCGTTRCPFPTATIPPAGGVINGDTTGGTLSMTSTCAGNGRERTYLRTPATSGMATLETCGGAGFDTVVYLRTGGCSGTSVACNDDTCGLQSRITPMVTAGTQYTVVVDGYGGGDFGPFALTVTPPP